MRSSGRPKCLRTLSAIETEFGQGSSLSDIIMIICCVVIFLGALLYGLAKSGPQQTLGAAIVSLGLIGILAGGLLWSLGL